jgi:hypothetical protein
LALCSLAQGVFEHLERTPVPRIDIDGLGEVLDPCVLVAISIDQLTNPSIEETALGRHRADSLLEHIDGDSGLTQEEEHVSVGEVQAGGVATCLDRILQLQEAKEQGLEEKEGGGDHLGLSGL